ncbi:MAG: SDR family oxidoreductase [Pseudomonadota bacterium]
MSRPVALVTGASSGIGREFAKVFAAHGHDLVLVARRERKLEALAAEILADQGDACTVDVIAVDLGKAKGPKRLVAELRDRGIAVDALVNNAGLADSGNFAEMSAARALDIVNLNVRALTELSLALLPDMVERGRGRILNVASIVAFQPVPSMAVYSASKAYVLSLTESLSEELKHTGVTVSALCPGLTKTEMTEDIDMAAEVPELFVGQARDVAEQGYRACMRGEVIAIPGLLNQAFVGWTQTQPRWSYRLLSGLAARFSQGGRP